jgi:hypothetical protein
MRERSFHLICLFSAVALSGCPRPTVSIPQQFLLAYQARDGGAIVVRSSRDGTTWVDFPALDSPGATRGVGLAVDDSGLSRLVAWGSGNHALALRYGLGGTWENALGTVPESRFDVSGADPTQTFSAPSLAALDGTVWLGAVQVFGPRQRIFSYRPDNQTSALVDAPAAGDLFGRPAITTRQGSTMLVSASLLRAGDPYHVAVSSGAVGLGSANLVTQATPELQIDDSSAEFKDVCVSGNLDGTFFVGILDSTSAGRRLRMFSRASTSTSPSSFVSMGQSVTVQGGAAQLQCAARADGGVIALVIGDSCEAFTFPPSGAGGTLPGGASAFSLPPAVEPFALVAFGNTTP